MNLIEAANKQNAKEAIGSSRFYATPSNLLVSTRAEVVHRRKRHYRKDKSWYYKKEAVLTGNVATSMSLKLIIKSQGGIHRGLIVLDRSHRQWVITSLMELTDGSLLADLRTIIYSEVKDVSVVELNDFTVWVIVSSAVIEGRKLV